MTKESNQSADHSLIEKLASPMPRCKRTWARLSPTDHLFLFRYTEPESIIDFFLAQNNKHFFSLSVTAMPVYMLVTGTVAAPMH